MERVVLVRVGEQSKALLLKGVSPDKRTSLEMLLNS